MAIDGEEDLLNDADLYNFGDNWRKILDVMPELVVLVESEENGSLPLEKKLLEEAEKRLVDAIADLADPERVVPTSQPIDWGKPGPIHDSSLLLKVLRCAVHKCCVEKFIVVLDKEALETGEVLLIFLDMQGRVVRWCRLCAQYAEDMSGMWIQSSWDEQEFMDAELGEDYKVGGVCGHLLHL